MYVATFKVGKRAEMGEQNISKARISFCNWISLKTKISNQFRSFSFVYDKNCCRKIFNSKIKDFSNASEANLKFEVNKMETVWSCFALKDKNGIAEADPVDIWINSLRSESWMSKLNSSQWLSYNEKEKKYF